MKIINDLFISRRKEVHSAGHSVYRPAKDNALLLFLLNFLIPKVKELIALVIKQAIKTENLRRLIDFILFDPEKFFTSVLPRLTQCIYHIPFNIKLFFSEKKLS